ncbi:MAG: hypothetical protein C0597_14425 [Marinilabiliales bacterium]|nr:MAG: hypothetical protein C0597_14425 [Marinilabiliales bacterium]
MKKALLIVLLFAVLSSCEEESGSLIDIKSLLPTEVSYDGFQANWEIVEQADFYEIVLTDDIFFNSIIETFTIEGASTNFYKFENLEPDKFYYCKVRYSVNGEYSDYSGINSAQTNRYNLTFQVEADDGIKIFGELDKRLVNNDPAPLFLFMHQGGQDLSEWRRHQLYKMAVDSGFICAAIDFRAHGRSEGVYSPNRTKYPDDLHAVLDYLNSLEYVEQNNIVAIGASLGAIMATGISSYSEVTAAVAISSYYYSVFETFGDINVQNVFYITSEYDNAINSEMLFDITSGVRKIKIISRSGDHGLRLLESEDLVYEVYDWMSAMANQ